MGFICVFADFYGVVAADFTQELLTETRSFRELMDQDRSVARKVLDAVKEFVAKAKKVFAGNRAAQDRAAVGTYGADMDTLERAVSLWGEALSEGAETVRAQKNTASESGGDKFSIKYDQNNIPFVVIESDILNGVPRGKWVETVKKTLARKFPDGVKVGNNSIKINAQTRKEMTYSEYTKWLGRNDKGAYADKFRAASYADEIILASRGYINEGLNHARNDNIRDFARGNVMLRVGDADYRADVIVGTTKSGSMLLYDIVNLQRTTIKEKSRRTEQPNQKEERRSGTPATESIAQPGENVNGQFSLKRDSQGRELTPEQAEFFKDSKVVDENGNLLVVYHATWNDEFFVFDRDRLGENTEGFATEELAESAHIGFWFNTQDLKGRAGSRSERCYLDIENPYESESLEAIAKTANEHGGGAAVAQWLEENGYDGVRLEDEEFGGTSFVVLRPEQIKRTDNLSPTEDPDIRYSLKGTGGIGREMAALQRENEVLKERVEYWKGQTRRSTRGTVDKKAVNKAAKALIEMYGAELEVSEINGELKALWDYMGAAGEVNYSEARRLLPKAEVFDITLEALNSWIPKTRKALKPL